MNKTLTISLSSAAIMASFLIGNEAVLTKQAQAGLLNDFIENAAGSIRDAARSQTRPGGLLPYPTHTTHPGHDIPGGPVFCITSPCPNQIPQPTHGYGGGVIPIYHHNTAF